MGLLGNRRRAPLPDAARAAVPLGPGERVLAWARDDLTGSHVVATTHHLALVGGDGALVWTRPWHDVEAGTWRGEDSLLTVTWVDHGPQCRWKVTEPSMIQQTLRERVQASVVLADEFRTSARRTVRVVIRQDLATGALIEQVIAGKGTRVDDPEVATEAARHLARLRSEIGR